MVASQNVSCFLRLGLVLDSREFLDSGTCFGFWQVFLDSGTCFRFWQVFLNSETCFEFWEVFWNSKCILRDLKSKMNLV